MVTEETEPAESAVFIHTTQAISEFHQVLLVNFNSNNIDLLIMTTCYSKGYIPRYRSRRYIITQPLVYINSKRVQDDRCKRSCQLDFGRATATELIPYKGQINRIL